MVISTSFGPDVGQKEPKNDEKALKSPKNGIKWAISSDVVGPEVIFLAFMMKLSRGQSNLTILGIQIIFGSKY